MVHNVLAEQGDNGSELLVHVWWPTNNDPWYLAYPDGPLARAHYYNTQEIPQVFVDGQLWGWSGTAQELRDSIAARLAIPSPLWMDLACWPGEDSVYAELKVVANSPVGAAAKLYIALADLYRYYVAWSGNDHWSNLLGMYPDSGGVLFTHSGNPADTLVFQAGFALRDTGVINMHLDNLKFVAWVQDSLTHEVLQSRTTVLPVHFCPTRGDTLYVGLTTTLRWPAEAFEGPVALEINRDYPSGTWELLFTNQENTGVVEWGVAGAACDNARIRVYEEGNPTVGDTTEGDFCIVAAAQVAVIPGALELEVPIGVLQMGEFLIANTGTTLAHVVLTANTQFDSLHRWLYPLDPDFDVPAGDTLVCIYRYDTRELTRDTVLVGSLTVSGNLIPFDVPVTLTVTGASVAGDPLPQAFSVSEAYPNPFNPTARIRFTLENPGHVSIVAYAITGQEVATLFDGLLPAGNHEQIIDGQAWATGTYFLRLTAGENHSVRKMLLLK